MGDKYQLDAGSTLILVVRDRSLYTSNGTGSGCYGMGPGGSFINVSPNHLTDDELILRRVDGEEYPWEVNGFEIPGLCFGLFKTLPSGSAGRVVYIDLSRVRPITKNFHE